MKALVLGICLCLTAFFVRSGQVLSTPHEAAAAESPIAVNVTVDLSREGKSETLRYQREAKAQELAAAERSRAVQQVSRSSSKPRRLLAPTTTAPKPVQRTTEASGDFWERLSHCESPTGRSGQFVGYFQFSRDTAKKVGIRGSETYEVQKAAAIRWAAIIHPREGTSAGWPRCWWAALRG